MHFGKFRYNSVNIGNDKNPRTPSGKRRMYFVSGRHDDDRLRNAADVFRKPSEAF